MKDKEPLTNMPLPTTPKPPKPSRLHANTSKPDTNQDVEKQPLPGTGYAAVVGHYHNRGNNKLRNGANGNATMSSHKSSDSASSEKLIDTTDLYDSVLNGGTSFDRKSGSQGRRSAASSTSAAIGDRQSGGSHDRRSGGSHDRRSGGSHDRRSGDSFNQRSVGSTSRKSADSIDRKSNGSVDRRSNGSVDRRSVSSVKKPRQDNSGDDSRMNGDYNDSHQTNGVTTSNKLNSAVIYETSDIL